VGEAIEERAAAAVGLLPPVSELAPKVLREVMRVCNQVFWSLVVPT